MSAAAPAPANAESNVLTKELAFRMEKAAETTGIQRKVITFDDKNEIRSVYEITIVYDKGITSAIELRTKKKVENERRFGKTSTPYVLIIDLPNSYIKNDYQIRTEANVRIYNIKKAPYEKDLQIEKMEIDIPDFTYSITPNARFRGGWQLMPSDYDIEKIPRVASGGSRRRVYRRRTSRRRATRRAKKRT
jgi:hypothetical protein